MPIDQGTLQGYDQLLSISQEAINRQLVTLYHTPIHPPINNGPKFLINHELNFHPFVQNKSGKKIPGRNGIDGFVCCPKIEFGGNAFQDPADNFRVAVIKFKFRRADDGEISDEDIAKGRSRDSLLKYSMIVTDEYGDEEVKRGAVNINEWEISWEALIDREDIQDVMKEIIHPANSADSPVALSQEVQKKLQDHVDSSSFQVSTIFCAMQDTRLFRSFRLRDQNGNVPSDIKNTAGEPVSTQLTVDEIMKTILLLFTPNNNKESANGTDPPPNTPSSKVPTPDNPFVLGYTISQKKNAVRPEAASSPMYLVPKSFRCNLSPKSEYSQGTLNYCMLTHRSKQPPDFTKDGALRVVNDGIDGAGRFEKNVFTRVKSKATPGACEGALFICQDIFMNHWIGERVAPLFYLDSAQAVKEIHTMMRTKYPHNRAGDWLSHSSSRGSPHKSLTSTNEYVMTEKFITKRQFHDKNAANDPTESLKIDFNTEVRVIYENKQPLMDSDNDLNRRLKFTITSRTFIGINIFRRLVSSHVENARKVAINKLGSVFGLEEDEIDFYADEHWEDAIKANNWINMSFTFEVGTSAANRGSFTLENVQCHHLDSNGSLKKSSGYPASAGAPGLWQQTDLYNWASVFSFDFQQELDSAMSMGESIAKNGAAQFKGALEDLVKDLGTTVILPAGDVFMFKGMSCDDQHNVFTTLTYDTPMGGEINKQESNTVSWETPKGSMK